VSDEALPDVTKSRILAIKTLTNRCLAFAAEEEATQVSEPVFQLLWPLVARGEETPYK
jgi:sister-chromatid-cohesion protein PDS5